MYGRTKKKESMNPCILTTLLCSILLVLFSVFPADVFAENNFPSEWSPDSYEIHLLLNSDLVLNENHLLNRKFLELFRVKKNYKVFSLAYYETLEQDFFEEGWINRIRLKYEEDEENDFSLTYKKRYPVSEGDLMSAVHLAESEGFNLSENKWEPEVDWGYTGMKLSLSAEVSIPADTEETIADLDPSEGFSMMMENMPEEEKNWKADLWGIDTFQRAEPAGPIFFTRYTGEFLSQKTRIEIWEIHDERDDSVHYLTELSFKTDHYEKATAIRKQMMDNLLDMGILLKVDSLKTQQMLDAYLVSPE